VAAAAVVTAVGELVAAAVGDVTSGELPRRLVEVTTGRPSPARSRTSGLRTFIAIERGTSILTDAAAGTTAAAFGQAHPTAQVEIADAEVGGDLPRSCSRS
jgi:hypothetical protein